MKQQVANFFKLKENNTNFKTECIAGITTFMTMSYIILVEPTLLRQTGMDEGSVMVATCLSSFIATILMGIMANYPIALAAAMGHNAYFTFIVCGQLGFEWQAALAAVFIAGLIYLLLTFVGVRTLLLNFIPLPLKLGMGAGIGLFITLIGFQWSGLVVKNDATMISLGDVHNPAVLLAVFGVVIIAILRAFKLNGAILYGMIATILAGIAIGIVNYNGIVSLPPSIEPTFFKLNFYELFTHKHFIEVVLMFLFLNLFDTIGTIIGVSQQAGFLDKDGKLPRGDKALQADAGSAVIGSVLGCSTVTSYVESSTGVASGGRTGFANIITASLFLVAIFFFPLVESVSEGTKLPDGSIIYPVIAPALIIVGSLMIKCMKDIDWDDASQAIPAFLAAVVMPFTYSITEGISVGIITYVGINLILKLFKKDTPKVHWIIYLFAVIFILRYVYLIH